MEIVILDGAAGSLGTMLEETLGYIFDEVRIYDRTPSSLFKERVQDAEYILTNKVPVGKTEMDLCPNLKYIGVMATGYNIIDTEEAHSRGITVTNVPAYSTSSVAQMTWAHILNIYSKVGYYSSKVRQGDWCKNPDFCMLDRNVGELSGKTIGLVGLGQIGSKVAEIARAFGLRVQAMTSKSQEQLPEHIKKVSFEDLMRTSDIVSLHCPQTTANKGMISAEALGMMKPSAILINTARGGLLDEQALAAALRENRILAAGLDVSTVEPAPEDSPLWSLENCFFTPHIAWASDEARERLVNVILENVECHIAGMPKNMV